MESQMEKLFEFYIRTTPERLWEAIVDPEIRGKYNFGAGVTSDWSLGSRLELGAPTAGVLLGQGEVLEVDPPRRLVHTMVALWSDDVKGEGASRVTWEIEPIEDTCRLMLTHDRLREGASAGLPGARCVPWIHMATQRGLAARAEWPGRPGRPRVADRAGRVGVPYRVGGVSLSRTAATPAWSAPHPSRATSSDRTGSSANRRRARRWHLHAAGRGSTSADRCPRWA